MADSSKPRVEKKLTQNNFLKWGSYATIGIALIFTILSVWIFSRFYSIADDSININDTSDIGQFIGGILGPILSFAGVLLFYVALRYQREDLKLQTDELKATRNEFHLNRLTNILYHQVDKIKIHIKDFQLSDEALGGGTDYFNADRALKKLADMFYSANYLEPSMEDSKALNKLLIFLSRNKIQILSIFLSIAEEFKILERIIKMAAIDESERTKLYELFILNLGADIIMSIYELEQLSDFIQNNKNYGDQEDIEITATLKSYFSTVFTENRKVENYLI